jgi:hypothetical protein
MLDRGSRIDRGLIDHHHEKAVKAVYRGQQQTNVTKQ